MEVGSTWRLRKNHSYNFIYILACGASRVRVMSRKRLACEELVSTDSQLALVTIPLLSIQLSIMS